VCALARRAVLASASDAAFALDREAIVRSRMVSARAGDLPDLSEAIGSLG
jgi:hypothetical protein